MSMSMILRDYLEQRTHGFELVRHARRFTSMETAEAAHVPGHQVVKTVMIEDQEGYLLAAIPSTHRLVFSALHHEFGRHFGLATECAMEQVFAECELGAVPPFGEPFGLRAIVDDALLEEQEVYCESGDHTTLVHLSGDDFRTLMHQARHGRFSAHV